MFSYFTLFAPLLSARVIYDNGAKSRREVALNTPVSGKDLLNGNLLSNLSFYLPFFGMIGTLVLSPFIGTGIFGPMATAIMLFTVLSLLIIIGLVTGSLISPVIFFLISKQKNDVSRAMVTLLVSAMMIISLPLLRFFLDNTTGDLGLITYLPFTIAASLMMYILYGTIVAINPITGLILMLVYIMVIFVNGWWRADSLYSLSDEISSIDNTEPGSKKSRTIDVLTSVIPKKYRHLSRSIIRASIRDVEHISRLSIGVAVTIFMIFAMSSRGLFRGTNTFPEEVELAVVIFSLVISSASVIFIDASSFTIQHRDMLTLIKSAPDGARKFIIAKIIQMLYFILPVFVTIIIVLGKTGFISEGNQLPLMVIMGITLIALICISLAIYIISPVDNQEDITNFINLLFFYVISFILATAPVIVVIIFAKITNYFILFYSLILLVISIISVFIAIKGLDEMDIETLNSRYSLKFMHVVKTLSLFFIMWTILPLFSLQYLLITSDVIGFLIISSLLSLSIPLVLWRYHIMNKPVFSFRKSDTAITLKGLFLMYTVAFIMYLIVIIIDLNSNTLFMSINADIYSKTSIFILVIVVLIIEEFIFRGFIFDFSENRLDGWEIIIFSSLLFSVTHFISLISLINAFVQGMILGYVRIKTGSLSPVILLHLVYNITVLLLIL